MNVYQAQPLEFPGSPSLRFLPEGPFAVGDGLFSWVAIQHGKDAKNGSINRYDLANRSNESFELPGRPGFAFPTNAPGTFVVGCERSLGFFHVGKGVFETISDGIDSQVTNTIINDGTFYKDNLVFGCKDLEFATKKAGLYLFRGSDSKLIQLRDDQICSNGKSIIEKNDGSLALLDIDSPTRQIVEYPLSIEKGTLGEPKVVLDLTEDPAVPDGAIVTPDGENLIVSMFLPRSAPQGETRMYSLETGKLISTWQTKGSPQNTCPSLVPWGGKLFLVITTAVEHLSENDQRECPDAGKIFIAETDFKDPLNTLSNVFTMPQNYPA